jgi:hypothetical protein
LNPLLNPDNYKDIDIKKSLPDKSEIVLEDFSNSLAQTKYRYCYYRLGEVRDMFSQEEVDKFETQWDKEHPNSKPIETCMIVDFVQYFNIKKEDFEMAIKKWIYWSQWAKVSIENEEYEIPNPDIIYTFDDDIINEYYRRK